MLLQVSDLHAGYGKAEVLRGLSIQAPAGSVITVIGPNGAGKSTLLGALMGLLPSRGGLRFDGQDISRLTLEERVMRGLALVPERRELFGTLSVEDNLVLGGWRPLKLKIPRWRDGLEQVFTLFPRLKERRLQEARRLLVESDLSIGEIATRLGFEDPLYFSRRFHQYACSTASEYRRINESARRRF